MTGYRQQRRPRTPTLDSCPEAVTRTGDSTRHRCNTPPPAGRRRWRTHAPVAPPTLRHAPAGPSSRRRARRHVRRGPGPDRVGVRRTGPVAGRRRRAGRQHAHRGPGHRRAGSSGHRAGRRACCRVAGRHRARADADPDGDRSRAGDVDLVPVRRRRPSARARGPGPLRVRRGGVPRQRDGQRLRLAGARPGGRAHARRALHDAGARPPAREAHGLQRQRRRRDAQPLQPLRPQHRLGPVAPAVPAQRRRVGRHHRQAGHGRGAQEVRPASATRPCRSPTRSPRATRPTAPRRTPSSPATPRARPRTASSGT